jgi:anti-sigma factor RsiW
MRTHLATKRLSAYLDEELPDREQREVEAHVSQCSECRSRLGGLRLVVSELQRVPAVEAPPTLAHRIESEAAMRWGPRPPGAKTAFGRRGLDLLRDMIQLSAVTAGAVAIIAMLIAYASSRDARPTAPATAVSAGPRASERVEVAGRSFVYREGAWWQERASGAAESRLTSKPTMTAQDALLRAPWLTELLRRGPVVLELDGRIEVVDLTTAAPSAPR